jgi:hypothetical protein
MAQENVGINITVQGNAVESIGSVKKELKAANAELVNAQSNFGDYSKEAITAAKRVAELKDKISEARETADLFDPGKKFQAFAGAINAVAGGFTAVQGALGVVGAESEELQKSLLKVQSALALSQGLSAITDSAKDFQRLATIVKTNVVTAFSTLRGALIATGIGALAIGVALVAANFDKVKKAVLNLIPGLAQVGTFFSNIITKVTDFVGVTSAAERALDSLEKSTKRGNESIAARIKILTAQGGKEKEIYELTKQQGDAELNALRQRLATKGKLTEEEQKRFRELGVERQVLDAQEQKRRADNAKQAADTAKGISDKLAEEEAEKYAKRIEDEKKLTEQLLEEYDKRRGIANNAKILSQKELKALDAQDAAEKAAKQKEIENEQIASLSRITNYTLQGILKQQKINEDARNAELQADIALQDAKFQAVQSGLNLLSSLAGQNEKIANAIFVIDKALAIAKIVVDTQREIAGYYATYSALGPKGLIAATKFSLAAKIRAGAGIASIAATSIAKFKGSGAAGGAGGGTSAPSVSAEAPITPPQPQAATTNLSNQTINAIGNQAVRAYVVENDVTSNQQRIAAIQQRARFG